MARPRRTEYKNCGYCKKVFETNCFNRKNIYCGKPCSYKGRIGSVAWNTGKFSVSRWSLCKECSVGFKSIRRSTDKKYTVFCSIKCRSQFTFKLKSVFLVCKTCKITFRTNPGNIRKNKQFCSNKCCKSNPEILERQRIRMTGSNSPNWKGGITVLYRGIRRSAEYQRVRRKALERDDFQCVWCNKKEGRLDVDHIKPLSKFPNLIYDLDNLRTLCFDCHRKTDTYGVNKSKYSVTQTV